MTEQHNTQQELDFATVDDDFSLSANSSVEIQIEKIGDRSRQITANILISQGVEEVWKVLTDYEALVDFVPNLAKSRRLKHPLGGIRLEQIGSQRLLNFNFCARVVLDLEEIFPKLINFRMVEGDFKGFYGSWQLEPCLEGAQTATNLSYTVCVWPKLTMPIGIIERRLSKDLCSNLLAIRQRVEYLG